jgi:hypothetical protein
MMGTKNGEVETDRKQTRFKYSPAHQDVAVCCNPNAGRITPYFIQNSWMKENENTLVATLLLPNILETTVAGNKISIENVTEYPNKNEFNFRVNLQNPTSFTIKIRKPNWVKSIETKEKYSEENGFILIKKEFKKADNVRITFKTEVEIKIDSNNKKYFAYGPLIFAKSIEAEEIIGKKYANGFSDFNYKPITENKYLLGKTANTTYKNGIIFTELINQQNNKIEKVQLIPMGKTILRQVTF